MCDSAYWIGQVAKRYNAQGPEGMKNRQHTTSRRTAPLLSVELQPAEHLCPLTNTALFNRHFADLDELEDAQARRCVVLQHRRDLIRSATCFSW